MLALEFDPKRFELTLEEWGPDALRVEVAQEELASALNRFWAPRYLAYAEECRKISPIPSVESLDARGRAMFEVYCNKIASWEREWNRRPSHESIICELPVLGILAARTEWPGRLRNCVMLTRQEWEESRVLSKISDDYPPFPKKWKQSRALMELRDSWPTFPQERWWACRYYWEIKEPSSIPKQGQRSLGLLKFKNKAAREYWLSIEGYYQDEIGSSDKWELWVWDGVSLNLVRELQEMVS